MNRSGSANQLMIGGFVSILVGVLLYYAIALPGVVEAFPSSAFLARRNLPFGVFVSLIFWILGTVAAILGVGLKASVLPLRICFALGPLLLGLSTLLAVVVPMNTHLPSGSLVIPLLVSFASGLLFLLIGALRFTANRFRV